MLKAFFRWVLRIYVWLYQRTNGRAGGRVQGLPVLLLTTTGRKTGKTRITPLGYLEHDGFYVVTASNAGLHTHPGWYHNLLNNPKVGIQIGGTRVSAIAEPAHPELRKHLWAILVERAPGYGAYQKRTTREIPMILLRRISQDD